MQLRILFALVLGSLLATGCDSEDKAVAQLPPPRVVVATPLQREVVDYLEFSGQMAAVETVNVMARVSGYLVKVGFEDGQDVKKGQSLFEIDPEPYDAALLAAKAKVQQAQASLTDAKANLARTTMLFKSGNKTQEDLDLDIANHEVALAAVAQTEAEVKAAVLNVDYTKIVAVIDGRTGKANLTVGNLVSPANPQVLTTIVSISPIYVNFDVDEPSYFEARRKALKVGKNVKAGNVRDQNLPVQILMGAENEVTFDGYMDFIDNSVQTTTGTIMARAVFDNKNGELTPGMYCIVRVKYGEPTPGLFVPERAIGIDQGQQYVLVVNDDGVAEQKVILPGIAEGDLRQVIEGIESTDLVVVNGLQRVRPGAKVDAEQTDMKNFAPETPQPASPAKKSTDEPANDEPGT